MARDRMKVGHWLETDLDDATKSVTYRRLAEQRAAFVKMWNAAGDAKAPRSLGEYMHARSAKAVEVFSVLRRERVPEGTSRTVDGEDLYLFLERLKRVPTPWSQRVKDQVARLLEVAEADIRPLLLELAPDAGGEIDDVVAALDAQLDGGR